MEIEPPAEYFEQFMHKNRLQHFTQKSGIPFPEYRIVNEGDAHTPQFRATVVVDGKEFTSHCTFSQRKAAEQDVAKIAFDSIWAKIETEGFSLIPDMLFCKSILHEYAVKMNLEKPTYTTSQIKGNIPVFTSSLIFNGQTYTGVPAMSKKEVERMAAQAVIEFILANSATRAVMGEIIKSKRKLGAMFSKKSIPSGLATERNVCLWSHTQNNTGDTIYGKDACADSANNKIPESILLGDEQIAKATATESFTPEAEKVKEGCTCADSANNKIPEKVKESQRKSKKMLRKSKKVKKDACADSANNKIPESILLGDEQIAKAAATESFTPEAEKVKEGCTCELSCGPNVNGSSQPTRLQDGSLASMPSSITSSDGSHAHGNINDDVKQGEPSTRPEDSPAVVLTRGMKRSDTTQNGGNVSKKSRMWFLPLNITTGAN